MPVTLAAALSGLKPRWRLSRLCYDKAHRCPGWAGGGGRYAKRSRCEDGRIQIRRPYNAETMIEQLADGGLNTHPGAFPLKFGHCTTCNVITLPWATRHLDPTYWADALRWKARKARWFLKDLPRSTSEKINYTGKRLLDRFFPLK